MVSIVVVGSSNTDMVIRSSCIPVPGETILGGTFAVMPGGKGANQAVAAARLGGHVTFVARIGTDMFGDEALNHYGDAGINCEYIVRDHETPSGIAMINVDDQGENAIAVASGANMRLTPVDVERARDAISQADILVLQLEVPVDVVEYAIQIAWDHDVDVVLNPAPARDLDDRLLERVTYLTPNELETGSLTGMAIDDEESASQAARKLLKRGVRNVVITMGASGSWWANSDGCGMIRAPAVSAVDTTAAGDAFNGGLAVAIARGKDLQHAVTYANCVGACAVTRAGAQPSLPTEHDVLQLMTVTPQ